MTAQKRDPDVLSADEVAGLLGISRKLAYDAASRGEIPCRRIGRRLFRGTREVSRRSRR